MDLEHRAVQPALDQLWAVIWRCALLEEGSHAPLVPLKILSETWSEAGCALCAPSKDTLKAQPDGLSGWPC